MTEVIYIDEDSETAELGEQLLELKTGADVEGVTEPYPSLEHPNNYQVVISDYEIGDITATELYDDIESEYNGSFVIFTGFNESYIDISDRDIEVVTKPDHDGLVEIVEKVLG